MKLLLLSTCLFDSMETTYIDTNGACTILRTKPKTPFNPSDHQVCATLSLPPISGAIIAMEIGKINMNMITEEINPEMIVQINADGDVISDLMSPIDGSFCERRVPGGIGM